MRSCLNWFWWRRSSFPEPSLQTPSLYCLGYSSKTPIRGQCVWMCDPKPFWVCLFLLTPSSSFQYESTRLKLFVHHVRPEWIMMCGLFSEGSEEARMMQRKSWDTVSSLRWTGRTSMTKRYKCISNGARHFRVRTQGRNTIVQESGVSKNYLKEVDTFIHQGFFKLIKCDKDKY